MMAVSILQMKNVKKDTSSKLSFLLRNYHNIFCYDKYFNAPSCKLPGLDAELCQSNKTSGPPCKMDDKTMETSKL